MKRQILCILMLSFFCFVSIEAQEKVQINLNGKATFQDMPQNIAALQQLIRSLSAMHNDLDRDYVALKETSNAHLTEIENTGGYKYKGLGAGVIGGFGINPTGLRYIDAVQLGLSLIVSPPKDPLILSFDAMGSLDILGGKDHRIQVNVMFGKLLW
jgi:hypothetical protein